MGSLCVAGLIEFECPVTFVHSCIHDRLRARDLIIFSDNSSFLPRIQMREYGLALGRSFPTGWSFI